MLEPALVACHLTAWGNAWLCGQVPVEEVLTQLEATGPVRSLGLDGLEINLRPWLFLLRDNGSQRLQVLLPAAGDMRGMPPRSAFADRVGEVGHGVAVLGTDLGILIERSFAGNDIEGYTATDTWSFDLCPGTPGAPPDVGEAGELLTECVAAATAELRRMELIHPASRPTDPSGARVSPPPTTPTRVASLIERVERIAEALHLAASAPSGARSSFEEHTRSEALRRLADAVRVARLAAWNAAVPQLL